MIFTTTEDLQNYLISQPETGMGYQVLLPSQKGLGAEDLIVVLNAQIAFEFKDLKNIQTENKSLGYNDIKDYNIINSTQLNSFF